MDIGVIGGSGVYKIEGELQPLTLETPYGKPTGDFMKWKGGANTLYFVPRHGATHNLTPSEVNYAANVWGLKKLGVQAIVSVSAVGSMKEKIAPGDFVLPDQYIDRTRGARRQTFFGEGVVGHAHFARPTCPVLSEFLSGLLADMDVQVHVGGTYVCVEGPQFSTRAESELYRSWENVSVVGMTALPEARLAREAGLCYQTVAMATDYDCWNDQAGDLTVEDILRVIGENVSVSKELVSKLGSTPVPDALAERRARYRAEMSTGVITPKDQWPDLRRSALETVLA